jgi:hypothetical protein
VIMRLATWKRLNHAASRHPPTVASTRLRTPWRFKSSPAHKAESPCFPHFRNRGFLIDTHADTHPHGGKGTRTPRTLKVGGSIPPRPIFGAVASREPATQLRSDRATHPYGAPTRVYDALSGISEGWWLAPFPQGSRRAGGRSLVRRLFLFLAVEPNRTLLPSDWPCNRTLFA